MLGERNNESYRLIRKHLVKEHTDGDTESLFVRFEELCNAHRDLIEKHAMLRRTLERMGVKR